MRSAGPRAEAKQHYDYRDAKGEVVKYGQRTRVVSKERDLHHMECEQASNQDEGYVK
jgi:hypothetical protein